MSMIFKIAKTELRNLFYSPVAWFLSISFMVLCGYFYTHPLYGTAEAQERILKENPAFTFHSSQTISIFLYGDSMFAEAMSNLFLFIPLLTMGLISRERNEGTIKLLYSSPIKTRHFVLGKYVAMMLFNLLLVMIIGIFIVTGLFNIRSPDYGLLLAATIGFYLMLCAYAAIGMFMSSVTNYQIVSALSTFAILFVLDRIGNLWQKVDFVRDLTYFLSMQGRTLKMLHGLVTTKDVIYFLVVMYMFVGFTLLRLKGGKEVRPWFIKAGRYLAVVISGLMIGYVFSRPGLIGYFDLTKGQRNTIHKRSQEIIKEPNDAPLEVTLYVNLFDGSEDHTFPEKRNEYLWEFWERYVRFKPDIRFKYVYYYDWATNDSGLYRGFPGKNLQQIAKEIADLREVDLKEFIPRKEIRKKIDLEPEDYRAVMELQYKGRRTFLRTFPDGRFWPDEAHVDAAIKRLLQERMPKVFFITGDLERSIVKRGEREFSKYTVTKSNREALVNLGFDVDTLSLDKQEIPADADVLVLADPKTKLSAALMEKLRKYIDKGGDMLILGEPGKQIIMNPLLTQLGIQLMDGTLVQLSKNEMPHMVLPLVSYDAIKLAPDEDVFIAMKNGEGRPRMLMPGVAPIVYQDSGRFKAEPLLTTVKGKTWLKLGALVTDSAPPVFTPNEGDVLLDSFATGVMLTRQVDRGQQRIVVCGDADFMSNLRGAGYLGTAIYSWMDNGKFPVYSPLPHEEDDLLRISVAGVAEEKIIFIWVLPGLLLIGGTIFLIRRKRQ